MFESSAHERRLDMKKASTTKSDQDIPEMKREQLGVGVRGKYLKHFTQETQSLTVRSKRTSRKRAAV
jgi:hypothetical protein